MTPLIKTSSNLGYLRSSTGMLLVYVSAKSSMTSSVDLQTTHPLALYEVRGLRVLGLLYFLAIGTVFLDGHIGNLFCFDSSFHSKPTKKLHQLATSAGHN